MKPLDFVTLEEVAATEVQADKRFFSATFDEIERGLTSDIYFVRTRDLLQSMGLAETEVTAEIFTSRAGVLAGIEESLHLLKGRNLEIWSLPEGAEMAEKEVVMRIQGCYGDFGIYETPLLGILSSSSGWATGARD